MMFIFFILGLIFNACNSEKKIESKEQYHAEITAEPDSLITDYWTQGKAEISVYELKQNRYREIHEGKLISIFVREDFLTDSQVKNEAYTNSNSVPVLKNIQIREFNTGLYSYYLQHAAFTPWQFDLTHLALKVTASQNDWCGQILTQMNWRENAYDLSQLSYFEREGDRNETIKNAIPEESIFTLIRLKPETLPQGEFNLIPALNLIATQHWPLKSVKATAALEKGHYHIKIPELKRELIVYFNSDPPHEILSWTDSYPSVGDKMVRTTEIKLLKSSLEKYWEKNNKSDNKMREFFYLSSNEAPATNKKSK